MAASSLALFASTGPYFPTLAGGVMLFLALVGPFLLLAIIARSLLGADPVPSWLLVLAVLGAAGLAFLLWPARITDRWTGFWGIWRVASIVALVLLPAVAFMEAGKRDFFRRPDRKRSAKKHRPKQHRGDNGVFVRDDS